MRSASLVKMGFRHQESYLSPSHQSDLNSSIILGASTLPLDPLVEVATHARVSHALESRSNDDDPMAIPPHPLGIKPAGNAYSVKENIMASAGFFAILPEELIIQTFEHLDATALQQLQRSCKALYAFARLEDLWKTLYIK